MTGHLADLAMPAARIDVLVEPGDAGEDGADTVTFVLVREPRRTGPPLGPGRIRRRAARGRCWRSGSCCRRRPRRWSSTRSTPASAARPVRRSGRHLAELARRHQVLCVTHLAQVAAYADAQVVVSRSERTAGGRLAGAAPVDGDARVSELARMLAGLDSDPARRHAAELLESAQAASRAGGAHPASRRRRSPS